MHLYVTMYLCVTYCMTYVLNNLWCSNSRNLCVFMFVGILYIVFQCFSSMLLILHDQSMYNMHKPVTTICIIFIDFTRFFLSLGSTKTDEIGFAQNRPGKPAKPNNLPDFGPIY
jgi:hypothetical protein